MSEHNGHVENNKTSGKYLLVWDLPTRLFHCFIVVLVIVCAVTGKVGIDFMRVHMVSGYGLLTLLLFRLIWGFVGGHHSRFATFVCGPVKVFRYAAGIFKNNGPLYLGHNPLGGWSVMAMLGALLLQVTMGLFASDDIFTEGPLYPLVSNTLSGFLTRIHKLNAWVIVFLVTVHVLAVLFYLVVKRENLIKPMINGVKWWRGPSPEAGSSLWAAAAIAGLCAGMVYLIVRYMPHHFL